MARLVGINHVAIEVGDLEAALELWHALFPELTLRSRSTGFAEIDMGDQFLAMAAARTHVPNAVRHFGLVVDDPAAVLDAAREAGCDLDRNTFTDPWGNNVQVVAYGNIQFTKTPEILRGMGLDDLEKSESALAELREKNLV